MAPLLGGGGWRREAEFVEAVVVRRGGGCVGAEPWGEVCGERGDGVAHLRRRGA